MHQSTLFRKSPLWRRFDNIPCWSRPSTLNSWLNEQKSLTQRLRTTWANVCVTVLLENKQPPFIIESQYLRTPRHHYHLVREVMLHSNNKPLILARTIIPPMSFKIAQGALTRLKTKPLGEVLFSTKRLKRQLIGITHIEPSLWSTHVQKQCLIDRPVLGRCTCYYLENKPIMVNEFFLPALFEKL
jgi:chorismate--pyruvate lyase